MGIVPASRGYFTNALHHMYLLFYSGFIAGNVSYRFNVDGAETTSWVDCTAMGSGDASQSICSAWADSTKRVDILSNAKCILVIEKEGVFRRYDKSIYDVNTAIENLRYVK